MAPLCAARSLSCFSGSAAGLVLGVLASRLLASFVYQATPRDPLVLLGAVGAMAIVGLIATWIPATRALAVDPAQLLAQRVSDLKSAKNLGAPSIRSLIADGVGKHELIKDSAPCL